jgi:MFS family permease
MADRATPMPPRYFWKMGGYVALSPALLADYFAGPKLSSVIGLQYTAAGLGSLLGPIIAGMLFDGSGTYTLALVIGAGCSFAASYLIVLLPEPEARRG